MVNKASTTALLTGMRPNELIALKWKNIDLTLGKITVREGRVHGIKSSPKTESSYREIDILPPLKKILLDQKAKTFFRGDYVFVTKDATPLDNDNLRNRVWYPTLKKAGLRERTCIRPVTPSQRSYFHRVRTRTGWLK
jgi:integrase